MPRNGNTTRRGYGHHHQTARAAALANYQPGQPCARCGRPLPADPKLIDLGHDDHDRTRYRGLEHRSCNRSAGTRKGNRLRGARRALRKRQPLPPAPPSRKWLG